MQDHTSASIRFGSLTANHVYFPDFLVQGPPSGGPAPPQQSYMTPAEVRIKKLSGLGVTAQKTTSFWSPATG